MDDAGEVSATVLVRLQRLQVCAHIRRVRVPARRFRVLLEHEVTILENLEPGDTASTTQTRCRCAHSSLSVVSRSRNRTTAPPRRYRPLDLVIVFVRLFEFLVAIDVVEVMVPL